MNLVDSKTPEQTFVPKENKRIYYFDVLRALACLAVVVIHSSSKYVWKDFGSLNFWIGNFADSIARIGVPIFVMISGALMLDEKYNFTVKKLVNHIKKMIIFFVFWSFLYCVVFEIIIPINQGMPIYKGLVFLEFIKGHYHLWFVFMIVGLYLILPLLRTWIKKENKKAIEYFLILSFIFTYFIPEAIRVLSIFNPVFKEFNTVLENIGLRYIGGYTAYFILGWYLHNFELKRKGLIYILGAAGLTVTSVGTYVLSAYTNTLVEMYYNLSLNVLAQSVALFLFCKSKFGQKEYRNIRGNKLVLFVSKHSLGVYAIHAAVIEIILVLFNKMNLYMAILEIPVSIVVAFSASLILSYLISKIPILKHIV